MRTTNFVHLNVHSHYSILDGCSTIKQIVDAAIKNRMPGIAITDNGNMFGIMEFVEYVNRINRAREEKGKKPFKPIIGCELRVAKHGSKEQKDGLKDYKGYPLTILAKNLTGYRNLMKIVSNAWTDGFYVCPRTDRVDLEKYHEGLIILSGGVGSEVFTHISREDMNALEETIRWYKRVFADDYYLELQRYADYDLKSNTPSEQMLEQEKVNQILIQVSKELGVKVVATNDVHYVEPGDIATYNIQQCIAVGKTMVEYENKDPLLCRWLRNKREMNNLFSEIPEAISNTMEIFDKVERYDIRQSPVMPPFAIPAGFCNDAEYLEYLTYAKAKLIYGDKIPEEVGDRLRFELDVIQKNRVERYFLFLQNVVSVAEKELGALVGPGRGSVGGCLTAYCLGITKIDPLKHGLLFERFMSPDRLVSPDIDLDFDEEGRSRIVKWLEDKYGKESCAHIISFHKISPSINIHSSLAGTIKEMGVHACGFVVSEKPISEVAPICVLDDPDEEEKVIRCTQYDGLTIEYTGLIKFDFLSLKALSQLKNICERVAEKTGNVFDIEKIPIDDLKTFELFQQGNTEGIFQYDIQGIQHYLRKLHPTSFEDLVLLNAMYRPGPMENIPSLIRRKHGRKNITYAIPCMEKHLHETYGIMVYQEQLMLLSRLIAGFNRSESDLLRKALCRRRQDVLLELKPKFIEGGLKNGYPKRTLNKIWKDWEHDGIYTLNKAHAVCYSWLAYQMAYLKANYTEEFLSVMNL